MFQVLAAIVCQILFSSIKVTGYDCCPFRHWLPFFVPLCSSHGQTGRVCHDGLEGSFFMSHDVAVDLVPSCLATIVSCNDKRRHFVQSFIIFKSHKRPKIMKASTRLTEERPMIQKLHLTLTYILGKFGIHQ